MLIKNFTVNEFGEQVYNLFMSDVVSEGFYQEFDKEGFYNFLYKNPHFKESGAFVAVEGEEVIGFALGWIKKEDEEDATKPGYFNTIFVKKEYRRQYVATKLFEKVVEWFKANGKTFVRSVFLGPCNWPWYIPETEKHNHPGLPAVPINTPYYFFLTRNDFHVQGHIDAFHLPLAKFEMNPDVLKRMEENEKKGLKIEVYDPEKHYGVEEFCEAINNPGFARSIRYNLNREKPYPFLIVSDNGRMAGWTGPMYTESTGRGHLDGIAVDPNVRGGGLGKSLFCSLCDYSKKQGSSFMTFFTGLENPARYIYLYAGFRICQSFAIMKKEIK